MIWNWAPCTMWADIFSKWVDAFKYHWYSLMLRMFSGRIGRTIFRSWRILHRTDAAIQKRGHNRELHTASSDLWRTTWVITNHVKMGSELYSGLMRLLLWRLRTNLIDAYRACICLYPNIWRHFIFLTMAENNAILIYFIPTAPQLTRQSDTVHEARNEGRGFGRFRRARHTARCRRMGSVGEEDAADAGNIPKIGFIMF